MSDVRRDITQPSGWVGVAVFGGLVLILVGVFQIIAGLVGILNPGYWQTSSADLLVRVDFATWGWMHLSFGVLAFAAGAGIAAGWPWARGVGIALAGLSSLVNLAFLAAHPTWSALIIVFDVLVIYALAVHGKDIRA
jgi:hypothetical protein